MSQNIPCTSLALRTGWLYWYQFSPRPIWLQLHIVTSLVIRNKWIWLIQEPLWSYLKLYLTGPKDDLTTISQSELSSPKDQVTNSMSQTFYVPPWSLGLVDYVGTNSVIGPSDYSFTDADTPQLYDFIGPRSLLLFHLHGLNIQWLTLPVAQWSADASFLTFQPKVLLLQCM